MAKNFVALFLLAVAACVVVADPCGNLNAIYEQKISPSYRQFIEDFQVVDNNYLLVAQSYDISSSPKDLQFLGTRIIGLNATDRSELTLISQAYFNASGALTETSMITNGTRVFGISNAVKVSFSDKEIKADAVLEQRRSAVSFIVPLADNAALSNVFFMPLNATAPAALSGVDRDLDVIEFTYPFQAGVEKVYNTEGAIVADQVIDATSVAVQTDLTNKYQLQVRALQANTAAANDILGTFSFVALVTTQGSTKLVKYTATINPFNNNVLRKSVQQSAALVVPTVTGLSNVTTLGGLLFTTNDNGNIVVVVHLNKLQLAAFNALHKLALVIPEKQTQVPVLLTFDATTLAVTGVRVLGNALADTVATFFAVAVDARDKNVLVIAGNTAAAANQQRTAADNQRAFVIRVAMNGTASWDEVAALVDTTVVTDNDKRVLGADTRFVLKSVAVAAGADDGNRIVVGGWVGDYVSALFLQGRVSLVDIASGKANLLYSMDVGESGSNAVDVLRRQVANVPETLFLGMMMDAPSNSVADNPYRNVGSGFWQVDCSPRNNALELGVKISFFIFFGIVTIVFVSVVGFYGFMAIKMTIEKRRNASGYNNIN